MGKQIPNWLFAVIIVVFTVGFVSLLGSAMRTTTGSGVMVGKPAPDFAGETADGKTFRLSEHRGKVVLVNFWATWCGPCMMEIPDLVKLQETYGPKGLTIVGISGDDNLAQVKAFVKQANINYPMMMVTKDIMTGFGSPPSLPTSFLINKEGKVVWEMTGIDPQSSPYSIMSEQIEKAL